VVLSPSLLAVPELITLSCLLAMVMVTGFSKTPGAHRGVIKVTSNSRETVLTIRELAESKLDQCYPLCET